MEPTVKTILVIEDHIDTSVSICANLKMHGYYPLAAKCRDQAISFLKTFHIDIILMDFWMNGMAAGHFVEQVRKTHPWVTIVVTTAQPQAETVAKLLGADAYLTKPFDPVLLIEKIRSIEAPISGPRQAVRDHETNV